MWFCWKGCSLGLVVLVGIILLSDQEVVAWPSVSIALTMCLIPSGAGVGEGDPVLRGDDAGHRVRAFKVAPNV